MSNYPEHEKLSSVKDFSAETGAFLDWLTNEQQVSLMKYDPSYHGKHGGGWRHETRNIEQLLASYYEIDLGRLEKEKRQLLEEIREGKQ